MRCISSLLGAAIIGIFCRLHVADGALTTVPDSSAILVGSTFQLACAADDTSIGETNWQYTALSSSPVRIVYNCVVNPQYTDWFSVEKTDDGGCHLTVWNSTRSSAGTYTCMNGFDQAAAVIVMLDSLPNCEANPRSDLLSGDIITVQCVVNYNGSLPPRMRWTVNDTGAPINNDTTQTFPNQVNSRINVPVYPPTSRPYTCETYFDSPIDFRYRWVLPPVNVQYFVQNVIIQTRIQYFQQSSLICQAAGYPPPDYLWINLNTGVTFAGQTINVNPNGVSRYACNASNTIRGQTVTIQTAVVTNLTQEIPEFCGTPPTGATGSTEETPEPTTSTTPEPTTSTTPSTTTPEPIGPCGRLFRVIPSPPDAPGVPSGWTGMCYITQNDTELTTTQCRNLIVDLPPGYANYNDLLAAGGNFGCSLSTRGDFLQAPNACVDNQSQTTILASCPSCPGLLMCFRLPEPR